jgi:23S rRNA pseudouridine2605 synthase
MSPLKVARQRLHVALAAAGVASRRQCEGLVAAGRVAVNGVAVPREERGLAVVPSDVLAVDGVLVSRAQPAHVHLALHKPVGVISTMRDELGRADLGQLLQRASPDAGRLFHVGRLDRDTSGLLFLTSDGSWANAVAHPSTRISKTYLITLHASSPSPPTQQRALELARKLRDGVQLAEGFAVPDSVDVDGVQTVVTLHVGWNRIVRRMVEACGETIAQLERTAIGGVALGNLRPGQLRALSPAEVASLTRPGDPGMQ